MTEEEIKAKAAADAEAAKNAERKFTQADLDEHAAKIRRDEKRKAQRAVDEIKATAAALSPEKIQAQIADGIKAQFPGLIEQFKAIMTPPQSEADKAKAEADKAKAAGQSEADKAKSLAEQAAAAQVQALPKEVQAMLEGERKAREKLERELADQRKASAEAKRLQEEAAKTVTKQNAIEGMAAELIQAKPGLTKTAAKLMARTMFEDGKITIENGKARFVIVDEEAEFEEDRRKEVHLSEGAKRWAATPDSDELVPAPVSGPGALRENANARRNSQVSDADRTPAENMAAAMQADFFGNKNRR
jgi:hypothetical protein